ncbi:MAG: hypothetical protein ACFFBI_09645 [Promethearchaeota archaeon]
MLGLERTDQILSKKVGAYKLFFAKKEKFIPFEMAISYYKALISRFKVHIPNSLELAKQIGKEAEKDIKFSFGPNLLKQLKGLKDYAISRIILESFKNFYSAYDIFQPEIEITILKIDQDGRSATYRFKNSIFLEDSDDFIYHIYIMSGISEAILERVLNKEVSCEIDQIYISDNKDKSFFDLSILIE